MAAKIKELGMAGIFIKNMVCNRCIMAVKNTLEKLGLQADKVVLCEAELQNELTPEEKVKLDTALTDVGFELIDDKRNRVIEKIKNVIIDMVHHHQYGGKLNQPVC